nr:hypothetical protein [Oculatellaceae cyanobacterium Prado106]
QAALEEKARIERARVERLQAERERAEQRRAEEALQQRLSEPSVTQSGAGSSMPAVEAPVAEPVEFDQRPEVRDYSPFDVMRDRAQGFFSKTRQQTQDMIESLAKEAPELPDSSEGGL